MQNPWPRCDKKTLIVRNDWYTFKGIKIHIDKNKDKYKLLFWNTHTETEDKTHSSYYYKNRISNTQLNKIHAVNKPIILNTSGHFHHRTYAFNLANR